jgi:hypothetical protein
MKSQTLVVHVCNPSYPGVLATQESEIRKIEVRNQPQASFVKPYLEKAHHKKRLVEWLKV